MAGWSTQNTKGGREQKPRIYEQIDFYKFPPKKWITVRQVGPINSYAEGWMKVRKKDGSISKAFPKICLDYNPKTGEFDRIKKKDKNGKRKVVAVCPYRKGGLYIAKKFISNFIIRDLQKDEPRRRAKLTKSEAKKVDMLGEKWHIKELGSDSWTPARALLMPSTLAEKLAAREELNTHNGKAYPLSDPRRGMDVKIRYNPDAVGAAQWDVEAAKQTKLTEEEQNYLIYKLDVSALEPETEEEANKNWEVLKDRIVSDEKDKKNKKKSKKSRDEDEDDDVEEPRRKKNKKKTAASKKKSSSSKSSSKKKRKNRDMDDLDDFDV